MEPAVRARLNRADGSTDASVEGFATGATLSTEDVGVALAVSGLYSEANSRTRRGVRVVGRGFVLDVEILDGQNQVRIRLVENFRG